MSQRMTPGATIRSGRRTASPEDYERRNRPKERQRAAKLAGEARIRRQTLSADEESEEEPLPIAPRKSEGSRASGRIAEALSRKEAERLEEEKMKAKSPSVPEDHFQPVQEPTWNGSFAIPGQMAPNPSQHWTSPQEQYGYGYPQSSSLPPPYSSPYGPAHQQQSWQGVGNAGYAAPLPAHWPMFPNGTQPSMPYQQQAFRYNHQAPPMPGAPYGSPAGYPGQYMPDFQQKPVLPPIPQMQPYPGQHYSSPSGRFPPANRPYDGYSGQYNFMPQRQGGSSIQDGPSYLGRSPMQGSGQPPSGRLDELVAASVASLGEATQTIR